MPPPKTAREQTKQTMIRFRGLIRRKGWRIPDVLKLINDHLHPSDHISRSTANKLTYQSNLDKNLNSETILAIQKIVTDHQTPDK